MVRVLFAIYDPARRSADGSLWSWRAPDLSVAFLESFYYDKAYLSWPQDVHQLGSGDVWGGAARHDREWIGLYRYFNGGRDPRGRPGRVVLAAAFIQLRDAVNVDLSPLLKCKTFQWVAEHAATRCPLPMPPVLEELVQLPKARPDPDLVERLLRGETVECRGIDADQRAIAACLGLPGNRQWQCSLRQSAQETLALVKIETEPIKPPKPLVAFNEEITNDTQRFGDESGKPKGGSPFRSWLAFVLAVLVIVALVEFALLARIDKLEARVEALEANGKMGKTGCETSTSYSAPDAAGSRTLGPLNKPSREPR